MGLSHEQAETMSLYIFPVLLGIGGGSIRKMVITAVVFGTHEDKTYTVGYFDNFYLGEKGASL